MRLQFLKYYNILEWENKFTLGLNVAKKYRLYQKMPQIKVVQNQFISYKKLSRHICLSPPGVMLESSKNCHFRNIIIYCDGKVDSL